ncbi:MAG TPA: NAD(P)-dependent oxidoreductase [Candidatus Binataceae bacterium]|nr:NAD(P)-dependent oxidoreductase [Candidatus Binataceae bacterium]
MKRVLITGASGFIGRHCLQALAEKDYEVHAVGRRPLPSNAAITWHQADLLDGAAAVAGSIAPTHLLHLAWCATPVDYLTNPINRQWAAATVQLAEAFADAGGERFVGAGSCAEYAPSLTPCAEHSTPLRPTSLYGESKAAAYQRLTALAKTADFSFAWGRIFFPYGPYQARERLIPSVITALIRRDLVHCSAGNDVRDFIHVQDAAAALVSLLDSRLNGACNIGSGLPVTVCDVISLIGRIMDSEDLLRFDALPQRADEPGFIVAGTRRSHGELGWRPRLSLEEGLAQTVSWWRRSLKG